MVYTVDSITSFLIYLMAFYWFSYVFPNDSRFIPLILLRLSWCIWWLSIDSPTSFLMSHGLFHWLPSVFNYVSRFIPLIFLRLSCCISVYSFGSSSFSLHSTSYIGSSISFGLFFWFVLSVFLPMPLVLLRLSWRLSCLIALCLMNTDLDKNLTLLPKELSNKSLFSTGKKWSTENNFISILVIL